MGRKIVKSKHKQVFQGCFWEGKRRREWGTSWRERSGDKNVFCFKYERSNVIFVCRWKDPVEKEILIMQEKEERISEVFLSG